MAEFMRKISQNQTLLAADSFDRTVALSTGKIVPRRLII